MRIWLLCISIFFFCYLTTAQNSALQSVKGLPSDEVYDLFADSKGFIWAAHSLGISRYDGMNFKDFNHPLATGAGITDITEDKQGRIWCHNFNGQVFYIENEQMYLLEAYKYKEEYYYPRMVILDNQLYITSDKGLFILNTATLKGDYLKIDGFSRKQNSLTLTNKNEILVNSDKFYLFTPLKGLKELTLKNDTKDNNIHIKSLKILPLKGDTLYSVYEYNKICKMYFNNNTLHLAELYQEKNKLNTIIKYGDETWINTKKESHTTNGKKIIHEKNLSDIIKDKNGNKWFSSLENGLTVIYTNEFWANDNSLKIPKDDHIYSNASINHYEVYGTQKGNIYTKNKLNKKQDKYQLPTIAGSIEKLYALNNNEVIIAPSTGCYLLKLNEKKIEPINPDILTIKSIILENNRILIAHTNCIASYLAKELLIDKIPIVKVLTIKRSYSLSMNKAENKIFVALSNGLHELKKDSIFVPVLYNNEVISASSLLSIGDKTYATTFNNGLFIIDKNGIRRKSIADGLLSNKIFKLKYINNQLFILEQNNIQILDINSEKIIKTIALPTEKSSVVYDLWQEDSLVYLSSNKGLYKLDINKINTIIIPNNYILSITSDTSVISPNKPVLLPYSQNTIQFKVISPSFIYPEYTFFKYRILGGNDTTWQQTTTNESNISFAALKPGDYTFEAYAVNFQNSRGKTLSYQFSILKPWWQQWWFIGIILFCAGLILYCSIKLRIKAIDKKNNELVEKIALTSELRKSQLSTIVAQMNPHFIFNTLNTIQGLIYKNDKNSSTKYIGKFSELVRDILKNSNQQEISLEEELSHLSTYLELEKMRFEDDLNIILTVDEALDKNNITLPPILIQPYIENAIFHGLFHKKGQKNLAIQFCQSLKDNYLEITIDDNGIGRALSQQLNTQRRKHESFAISAIERRINLLNQSLNRKIEIAIIDKVDSLKNAIGTKVTISIPINGF